MKVLVKVFRFTRSLVYLLLGSVSQKV